MNPLTVNANAVNDPRTTEDLDKARIRNQKIIKTSIIGILANVMLAAMKAVIGLLSNSIAIVMDAVNNLSDAASSVITIVGTHLAGRDPDKKHPFGYGRIEYLSAMIISILVLYAGITAFTESVKKIIHPETPDYSAVTLVIVAVAVVVKIVLGRYVRSVGESVHSDSLINSGEDATLDSVISASTLAAAGIYLAFHISLEAWLGAVISIVIIKSGIEMLRDTLSRILGERAEASLAREIRATIVGFPEISGAYDLILHNYGPDSFQGSVHIEVPDTMTAAQLDELIRCVTLEVYKKHDILLTAVGVYSVNTTNPEAVRIREEIQRIAAEDPYVLQIHGFYYNEEKRSIRFDAIVSFDAPDRQAVLSALRKKVQDAYPGLTVMAILDTDFSES